MSIANEICSFDLCRAAAFFLRTKFSQNGVKNVPYHQAHTKNGVSGGLEKRLTALFLLFALVFVLL